MRIQILCTLAAVALLTGCTETRQHMGAAAETDNNVMTGGPIVGTTIADLPNAAKQALRNHVPHAEIADIEKTSHNGQTVYQISFINPGKNPTIYITQDGKMLSSEEMLKGRQSSGQEQSGELRPPSRKNQAPISSGATNSDSQSDSR